MTAPQNENVRLPGAERLTRAELHVLDLLAQGHTAKSIATTTGQSVGAVNERLREARRKTGVASSRELARRIQAQKNGDEVIGIATQTSRAAPSPSVADHPRAARSFGRKAIIMVTTLGAAAIAAIAFVQSPTKSGGVAPTASTPANTASLTPDVASAVLSTQGPDPRQLYALVRGEARDPTWAPRAEAAIQQRYARIQYVGGPDDPLTVRCASTVCEVAGSIPPGLRGGRLTNTMMALQSHVLEDLRAFGLGGGSTSFTSSKAVPSRMIFVSYWTREGR